MARPHRKIETTVSPPRWPEWVSWCALGLALALVVTRATMSEYLRDTAEVMPGSEAVPRAPGPATSLGLDLLCCVPAILVLARRMGDRSFVLRAPRSFIPLAMLSAWMLLSTLWAADKFAALVTAFHWASAMSLLWAAAQLVRGWVQMRLVAAVLFALLTVYAIQAFNFRFLDAPATLKTWNENRAKMMAERGLVEGSFVARQFEEKLRSVEVFGFFNSPNTFGAVASLLLLVGAGLLVQRVVEREQAKWAVPAVAIPMAAGLAVLAMTKSKGAATTVVLGLIALAALGRFRGFVAGHARAAYWTGVIAVIGGILAIAGYGLATGRLPTSTLTFRWHYWTGAARMIKDHPLLGTGWSNFSLDYLSHRLPSAPEEVKDPHNLLVRFFSELGIIGGALAIAWLLRLWWELTRPTTPPEMALPREAIRPAVVKFVAAVAGSATLLYLLVGVDWAREPIEFMLLRSLYLGVMIVAASVAGLRSLETQEADDRPAPWILYGVLLGVAGMLVHNLVDFSIFETAPLLIFAVLTGSALGVRASESSETSPRRAGNAILVAPMLAWLLAVLLVWGPIATAERKADEADDSIRRSQFATAEKLLTEANTAAWGLNSDYAYRAARAAARISGPEHWQQLMETAIRENPKDSSSYRGHAAAEMNKGRPDAARVRADYDAAVRLDPHNVRLRIEYAEVLGRLGDRAAARAQYAAALYYNDQLERNEKKRLSAEEIAELEKKIDEPR